MSDHIEVNIAAAEWRAMNERAEVAEFACRYGREFNDNSDDNYDFVMTYDTAYDTWRARRREWQWRQAEISEALQSKRRPAAPVDWELAF